MITKFVAAFAVIAMSVTISILTLLYGWGLEPKSRTAIIGWGVFGSFFIHVIGQTVLSDIKKK